MSMNGSGRIGTDHAAPVNHCGGESHHIDMNACIRDDNYAGANSREAPPQARLDHDVTSSPPTTKHNKVNEEDDELPRLANLVAATIRDKVVLDQMDELRQLRAQLAALHAVEITGPNGYPVYARGNFSKGEFNSSTVENNEEEMGSIADRLFWDVGLDMVYDDKDDCVRTDAPDVGTMPLNKLSNVEIRIGGTIYANAAEVEATNMAFGIRPGNQFDLSSNGIKDMTRSAVAEFNTEDMGATGGRAALLTFHLRDFRRGHWRSLQSVAMLNRSVALRQQEREQQREERREIREAERQELIERGEIDANDDNYDYESDNDDDDDEDQESLDVFNYLTQCLSKRHPEQRTDVTSVSLCVKSVWGRIEQLNRGEQFEQTKKKVFTKIDNKCMEEFDGGDETADQFDHLNDVNDDYF